MSGGEFDYDQFRIGTIHEKIQEKLDLMGTKLPEDSLMYFDIEWYKEHPEEEYYTNERDEVKQIFKDGIEALKKAEIYAQRIDWFLSGDDGEEALISRLKEDLDNLNKTK